MTNAERQRKYRDRKRGGPPVGRWPKVACRVGGAAGKSDRALKRFARRLHGHLTAGGFLPCEMAGAKVADCLDVLGPLTLGEARRLLTAALDNPQAVLSGRRG
jgi:hypothetical protein